MTDGDNLQWTLGPWATDDRWFGSPKRGTVPVGWTYSPAIASVAPAALQYVLSARSGNDELVAGPSGEGYTFPSTWPAGLLQDFANLTGQAMHRAGMRVINVLGQDDKPPVAEQLEPFLSSDGIDGMLFYSWGTALLTRHLFHCVGLKMSCCRLEVLCSCSRASCNLDFTQYSPSAHAGGGYSALQGELWWIAGKPVVSGRYSLWGTESTGTTLGVKARMRTYMPACMWTVQARTCSHMHTRA